MRKSKNYAKEMVENRILAIVGKSLLKEKRQHDTMAVITDFAYIITDVLIVLMEEEL